MTRLSAPADLIVSRRSLATIGAAILGIATVHASHSIVVTVVARHTGIDPYTFVVPGHLIVGSESTCSGERLATCRGSESVAAVHVTAPSGSFQVQGATLSLALPDGRVALVNCRSKLNGGLSGFLYPYRSCREPWVNDIQAEFDGDKATLRWPAALDSRTMERETYRLLGIIGDH